MKKSFIPFFFLFASTFLFSFSGHPGTPLRSQIKNALSPPNSNWVIDESYKGEYRLLALRIQKPGRGVTFTVNYYEIPEPAKVFLNTLREGAIKAPLYQGAEIGSLTTQNISGKSWDTFKIKGKEGGTQEAWARNVSNNVLLLIMYTAVGADFDQYHTDAMALMKQASQF